MPFVSRAQQRYAFATGQPWAERWAQETPSFEALPERTKKLIKRRERRSAIKADAPAPEKERIFGSETNPEGSAASAGSGRGIEITEAVESALRTKMQTHNERNDTDGKRATMGMLRAVWRRGAGAFSTSHRPGMTRQQWAMARVNAFLHLLARGKPENAKYVSDNDLLPEGHPKSTRRRSATKAQIRFQSLMKGPKPKKQSGGGPEVMERIAGELCRSRDGRFVSCSSREATPESKRELRKKERMQERQKEEAENMARIGDALGLERESLGALFAFGDRDKPKPLTEEQATALEALGLVERGDDGTPRISSSGNAFLRAVRSGDEARSRDTLSVSRERAERLRVAAEETAAAEAEPKEEQKPRGGGGGGRGAKPDAAELAKEREQKRAVRMLRAAEAGRELTTGQRRELERLGYGRRVDGRFVLNAAGRRALAAAATKAAASVVPPQAVRDAARRALEVREQKPPSQRGMTAVGLARARDLANGRPVSFETLRRMKAYFDRHEVDKQGSTWGEQGKGWQAWMGWGGDPGRAWANRMLRQMDSEVKDVDDVDLLLLEAEIAIKHGSHNQATHGRKTGRRAAYASAYNAARGGGASVAEARAKAKEASTAFRENERPSAGRTAAPARRESVAGLARRRESLQSENDRLMRDIGAAYRRAGAPGLSSSERRTRQQEVDALERRLREIQSDLRQASQQEIRLVREREGSY